ncbi:MAG: hypothetical protein R6X16_03225, partial [Anaerolineae bacterium]
MFEAGGYWQRSATRADIMTAYRQPGSGEESPPGAAVRSNWWGVVLVCLLLMGLLVTAGLLYSAQASGPNVDAPVNASLTVGERALAPEARVNTNGIGLVVNYSHDWVGGYTLVGATVSVIVTDGGDAQKGDATVVADGSGDYFVNCEDWSSGSCPDILPGDGVSVSDGTNSASIDPIGQVRWLGLDEDSDQAYAELHVEGAAGSFQVYCDVWAEYGPATLGAGLVDPDGGEITCDWNGVWDLTRSDVVAITYLEPDGDNVIAIAEWPTRRVNIAHDWAGANVPAGSEWDVTLTDNLGAVKATARMIGGYTSGWGSEGFQTQPEDWWPSQPDIVPGDRLLYDPIDSTHMVTAEVQIGMLTGTVDAAADEISGTVVAPDAGTEVPVACHPWGPRPTRPRDGTPPAPPC